MIHGLFDVVEEGVLFFLQMLELISKLARHLATTFLVLLWIGGTIELLSFGDLLLCTLQFLFKIFILIDSFFGPLLSID